MNNSVENAVIGFVFVMFLAWAYSVTMLPLLPAFADMIAGMILGYFGMKAPAVYDTFGFLNHTRPEDKRSNDLR